MNGSSYISLAAGNVGNDPASGAPWALLAAKGAGDTYAVLVADDGTVTDKTGDLAGGRLATGQYSLTNPIASNDLTSCAIVGTANTSSDARLVAEATAAHTITVSTFDGSGSPADAPFSLTVAC